MTPPSESGSESKKLDWTDPNAAFGPNAYARTRALWVTGTKTGTRTPDSMARSNAPPSEAQRKLEDALIKFDENDDRLWKGYLSEVHRRLVGGDRLKKGLKLPSAVRFFSLAMVL